MTVLYILAGVAVAVALLAAFVATRPAAFTVERSATIPVPPRVVFDILNGFRQYDQWAPWSKLDPAMTVTLSGPASGVGAGYAWVGNKQVGRGRMVITDSRPAERVGLDLHFEKPFKADNTVEYTLTPTAGGTTVRWAMSGRKNFLFKAVGLFLDMDALCGKDFERGLANLRELAESQPPVRAAA